MKPKPRLGHGERSGVSRRVSGAFWQEGDAGVAEAEVKRSPMIEVHGSAALGCSGSGVQRKSLPRLRPRSVPGIPTAAESHSSAASSGGRPPPSIHQSI